jgi:hypothetical protein
MMFNKQQRKFCADRYIDLWRHLSVDSKKSIVTLKGSTENDRQWRTLCEMLWLTSMVTWTPLDFVIRDNNFSSSNKNQEKQQDNSRYRIRFCNHIVDENTMDKCLECGLHLTSFTLPFSNLL